MHSIPAANLPAPRDWWTLSTDDLETLSKSLLGGAPEGWLRRGAHETIIASRYLAVDARTLPQALADVAKLASRIRTDGKPAAGLRAAAFYHLRFENIHPLREGNGRVGRLILAAQCEQATRVPLREILASLQEHENEYKWVFRPAEQAQRYELLLDLLARITATPLDESATTLTVHLEPERPLRPRPATTMRAPTARRSSFF